MNEWFLISACVSLSTAMSLETACLESDSDD